MNLKKTCINWKTEFTQMDVGVHWVYRMIFTRCNSFVCFQNKIEMFVKFCCNRLFKNCPFVCVCVCVKTR